MVSSEENEEAMYTAFTVTVDAREGISTGISAEDRARTLRMLSDSATQPSQLRKPGHICPLRYIFSFALCGKGKGKGKIKGQLRAHACPCLLMPAHACPRLLMPAHACPCLPRVFKSSNCNSDGVVCLG